MHRALLFLTALSFFSLGSPGSAREPAADVPATASPDEKVSKWEKEIAAFEAADQENPPPKKAILFIGSSSMRMWKDVAKDFPQHQVINRGFGGSMIADSVEFVSRIVLPYEPRLIFFYAGGNDINAHKAPKIVAEDFRAFATKVHARLPQTDIAFISVAPNPKRWLQNAEVKELNALVKAYCESDPHLKFIDVYSSMLGTDGQPKEGIYLNDGLHMNRTGYKIWIDILKPYLPAPDRNPQVSSTAADKQSAKDN